MHPLGTLEPHVVCAHNVFTMCLLGIWVLVPSVRERLQSMDFWISKLQMKPLTQVLEDWLARLEDRLQDQHKEIAILWGQVCRCGQQGGLFGTFSVCEKLTKASAPPVSPPIASLDEEEERLELDYADDPPAPRAEGTAQGKSVSPSWLSESWLSFVDWDGTLSEYLTPHLTPEVFVPIPSRWSGIVQSCGQSLTTSYSFQIDNVCSFQDGWGNAWGWGVVFLFWGTDSSTATIHSGIPAPSYEVGVMQRSSGYWGVHPYCNIVNTLSHNKWLANLFRSGMPLPTLPDNFPRAIRQVLTFHFSTPLNSMLELSACVRATHTLSSQHHWEDLTILF